LTCSFTDEQLLKTIKETINKYGDVWELQARIILAARIGDLDTLRDSYDRIKIIFSKDASHPLIVPLSDCVETIMQNYQNRDFIIDITDKWKNETIQSLKLQNWV